MRPLSVMDQKTYTRLFVAKARGGEAAEAAASARLARDRPPPQELLERAAHDASVCACCAAPLRPGQSVTLRWWKITNQHGVYFWLRAPVCLVCTLTQIRPSPSRWSNDTDHPAYPEWCRFRCRTCGRPVRIAPTRQQVTSPTCCDVCQERDRLSRNMVRRRVTHKHRRCAQCGELFMPKRADATTCSNRCRQAAHRERQHR